MRLLLYFLKRGGTMLIATGTRQTELLIVFLMAIGDTGVI
jgi:hypothetical protein